MVGIDIKQLREVVGGAMKLAGRPHENLVLENREAVTIAAALIESALRDIDPATLRQVLENV